MTIGELFGTLQQSIIEEWRKHLKTSKYSKHMALDEFYKDMPELVDTLIEDYIGHIGSKVQDYKNILDASKLDALQYLEELHKICQDGYSILPDDAPELKSDLDAIKSLVDSTMYKVRELRETITSLKDFLTECLNEHNVINESYSNIYPVTQGLCDLIDSNDIEGYLDDEEGIDDVDNIKFYKDFVKFLNSVKAELYTVEIGSIPDPDDEDIHDFLYDEDAIKKNQHGFLLNRDGDDDTSLICVINKRMTSADEKKLGVFLDAYEESDEIMAVEKF